MSINFVSAVLNKKRHANVKALRASHLREEDLSELLRGAVKHGWKSWEKHNKKRSCLGDENTDFICIHYLRWFLVCALPIDSEDNIRIEKYFWNSSGSLFFNMAPNINPNQMKAWFRLVNCVWNFNTTEEAAQSVCEPLQALLEYLDKKFSFSNEEWETVFLTKPTRCFQEDDLPMLNVYTMLCSRGDHASLKLLSLYGDNMSETMSAKDAMHYKAILTTSTITVGRIQPWEFTRNVTNPLLSCCLDNGPTVVQEAKELLDAGYDANIGNVHGWKPAHFAAFRGNAELLACLVVYGRASLQSEERHRWRPLHIAADRNSLETVEFIVEWQKLSLYMGLKLQDGEDIHSVSSVAAYLEHDKGQRGIGYSLSPATRTLLHQAWNNLMELVRQQTDPTGYLHDYLYQYGASHAPAAHPWPFVDVGDAMLRSALMLSSSMPILRYLLFHGANPLRQDQMFGVDMLNCVTYGTSHPTPEESRNERIRGALLLSATGKISWRSFSKLLMQEDHNRRTSLTVAIQRHNAPIIDLLISAFLLVPFQSHSNFQRYTATLSPIDPSTRSFCFTMDDAQLLEGLQKAQFVHPSIDVTKEVEVTMVANGPNVLFVVPSSWRENRIGRGVLRLNATDAERLEIICENDSGTLSVDPALVGPGLQLGQDVVYAINEDREVILVVNADAISAKFVVNGQLRAGNILAHIKVLPSLSARTGERSSKLRCLKDAKSRDHRVSHGPKSIICRFFQQHGRCQFGDACRFAHTTANNDHTTSSSKPIPRQDRA